MKSNDSHYKTATEKSAWRHLAACVAALALISLVGCSGESGAWKNAQQSDAIADYKQYLTSYPKGEHVAAAKARMSSLWLNMLETSQFIQKYANALQIATQLKTGDENSYMVRDDNGQIVAFPDGTTLTVRLADTVKKDKTAVINYTYVTNYGGAALFRSEEHGALILLLSQVLIPIPTWREVETEDVGNVVIQWKATVLSKLWNEMNNEKIENMRKNPEVYALIPLPSLEKLVSDPRFRKTRDAKTILDNRMKLLSAIEEAGSIKISSIQEEHRGEGT